MIYSMKEIIVLGGSSGRGNVDSILVFNDVDDFEMEIGAFQVVAGAGLAFLCVYTGT